MLGIPVHPTNAQFPMVIKESGKLIAPVIPVHALNAFSPIDCNWFPKLMLGIPIHSPNAKFPMVVKESGKLIAPVIPVQVRNA